MAACDPALRRGSPCPRPAKWQLVTPLGAMACRLRIRQPLLAVRVVAFEQQARSVAAALLHVLVEAVVADVGGAAGEEVDKDFALGAVEVVGEVVLVPLAGRAGAREEEGRQAAGVRAGRRETAGPLCAQGGAAAAAAACHKRRCCCRHTLSTRSPEVLLHRGWPRHHQSTVTCTATTNYHPSTIPLIQQVPTTIPIVYPSHSSTPHTCLFQVNCPAMSAQKFSGSVIERSSNTCCTRITHTLPSTHPDKHTTCHPAQICIVHAPPSTHPDVYKASHRQAQTCITHYPPLRTDAHEQADYLHHPHPTVHPSKHTRSTSSHLTTSTSLATLTLLHVGDRLRQRRAAGRHARLDSAVALARQLCYCGAAHSSASMRPCAHVSVHGSENRHATHAGSKDAT
eukprot:358308-Chlamydomonas_euryale.AAC.1